MTYVLSEIAMEMMGLKFYDMDGDFCETNFQAEDKKRKDKPNLLQELGLKRDAQGKLVNDSDNDDEQPTTSSRAKKQTQAASKSVNNAPAEAAKTTASTDVKNIPVKPNTKSDAENSKKLEAGIRKMSTETSPLQVSTKKVAPGNVNVRKTEVQQPKIASQGEIHKVAPGSVKVVNDSNSGIDVQIITEQVPIPASTSLIKKVTVGNVKISNANIQKTEVKPPIAASQDAVKVASGSLKVANGSNDNVNVQKITEQLTIAATIDVFNKDATGNAKVVNDRSDGINEQKTEEDLSIIASNVTIKKVPIDAESANDSNDTIKEEKTELIQKTVALKGATKKQYKLKENPILNEPKHIDFDAELNNMLPEELYETKYSELDLCTDEPTNKTVSPSKEGPFISVRSDLVGSNGRPVRKRSNSLIERTNVEYEKMRNLLIKHKTNYINNNGNIHHRMVLMGGYTPEKFMQPCLECAQKNLEQEVDLLKKYRCILEDTLAKNNPSEYNRILTSYNISKRAGIE